MIENIWKYRQFIVSCIKREFLSKYKSSILGVVWSIVHPLSMIFVYTVIFSEVMKTKLLGMGNDELAYSIYLCSGVLTWEFFVSIVTACVNVFFYNGNLMKKIAFPRICLPIISAGTSLINFCISYGLFLCALILLGRFPWDTIIFIFPVLWIHIMFACSLGIGLGVLNVFFRDVGQMLGVVLQFWFWFTPIVYPSKIIPEQFIWLMNFNPMYHVIKSYQEIFVYHRHPDWSSIVGVFIISVVLGLWSFLLYKRHVGEMVDEL